MPRKSTTDAVFALRMLMEKYREGHRELHCVFVDLEKAYDRVPREELWYCMRTSGVAEKYVRVVQDMYESCKTVVRCAVGVTEEFKVEVGLHQGSALSPFLFALVMDRLTDEVRQESPWTMMFADDIVICSESREQVEENLEKWRSALENRGLKLSRSKTEYMCVNERDPGGTVRLQGAEVKKVQDFKYLGSTVQSNGECGKEVKRRVQAGWNGWRKVSGVLCDKRVSARMKGKVFKTVVRPAMLFGLETVALKKRQEAELEVAELKMLRFSLGVTRMDRIRNEYIRGTAHRQSPGPQPSVSPDAGGQVRGRRKRCSRKRKRGKWAGVRARLNANPSRPALPSILLSNVCSLDNKLDYIRLQRTTRREFRDCCIFVFTETWLSDTVPEAAIQLDGLTVFHADRNAAPCSKTRGGGVCVYINTEWCKNSVLVSRFCSSLVEFVTVRCRPFYLPREFTTVFIVGVYIPPSANAKEALCELYVAISDLQNAHPDGLFIIAGDFNPANLRTVLPKLHQHVDFATRGGNTLDLVYTNIRGAYRAEPHPHLGYSDHISVMLIPAYRPLVRCSKPVLKQVKTWPAGAISALQDCFECTDWDMFREAATNGDSINLEEYTSTVTSYISKCVDDVTISKTITTHSNRKPWINANVCALLKQRDAAFRTGDKTALRTARAKLSHALNHFYARFEAQNNVKARKSTPPPSDQVLCLTTAEVRKTLCRVNPRKSAGPDNIPGRVLRECAEQLADVFTDIFNISLSSNVVPTCLKATTIVPVPKKSTVSCLNDYRPVALTPIVIKFFERLVMRHIKTQLPTSLDPMQFAYRPNRSTDDAISTTLHLALTHLDNKDSYVRMLFIDFSSAFNTIIPQHLIEKLSILGLNTSLCN
ncbi:hypothetical protein Q8A73_003522 [Channa argus]|nr:hypothetical protein Q8A73_003522 [Channa argus]